MASSIIHIVVANEVNKTLKKDKRKLLLGAVAPDLSKLIGENKLRSHFLDTAENDIPNINKFIKKYKNKLSDDFVMGYFIHLYTDYLWFKYFVSEVINKDYITKLNGDMIKLHGEMAKLYLYNDYTRLDIQLIDKYELDLKIIYDKLPDIEKIIDEIPMDKLDLLINQIGIVIATSNKDKEFIFNISNIENFISLSKDLILSKIKELEKS